MNNTHILNRLYQDIQDIILKRQHPVTGLLPASTAITTHGDYTDAWVRDNVYSIMSVWALGLAYRRIGETERSDELCQSTIKLMRGLLQSMMRQSDKVEKFKHTLHAKDALHAKYDTATGLTVVADDAWGHLQIDATSIFLLMIAQMSASGLRIVNTYDEVDFVQNLIYYIAFAYRIPDYGIWERGNKINNGKTEINASSVGMAKAALQALDGFNLFGKNASPRAIVHSIPDGISRARNTLARLLPRESISKEVDSAILSIIGFPAFAVGDKALVKKTRDKIISELGGNYGCKRFLWDGHQTAVEDHSRIHYEHNELTNFKDIESEWPLFFTYLYIQALYDRDDEQAQYYRSKLESIMVEQDGKMLIPELYYLHKDNVAAEKENPHSQPRVPNENLPLVWAQSLFYTGFMIDEGLIELDDLDPCKLRYRSTSTNETQIAVVILAENEQIKQLLANHGVIAETPAEIAPIGVMTANQLVEAYQHLGENPVLGLSGRPRRRMQSLATAKTYQINNNQYLCLSSVQQDSCNYRNYDAELDCEILINEINHINKHWINKQAAVVTYMVTQSMCESAQTKPLFDTLKKLQLRNQFNNVGYASAALALRASCNCQLNLPKLVLNETAFETNLNVGQDTYPFNPAVLKPEFAAQLPELESSDQNCYQHLVTWAVDHSLTSDISLDNSVQFRQLVEACYQIARHKNFWLTARWCFSALGKAHADLADDLSLLCSRNLSILVGTNNLTVLSGDESLLDQEELLHTLDIAAKTPLERTLVQELLVILSYTIRTNTQLFNGVRSIHLHNMLSMCSENSSKQCATMETLAQLSPHQFMQKVQSILENQHRTFDIDVKVSFSRQDGSHEYIAGTHHAMDTDWLLWRSERGLIARFDDDFISAIWQSLAFCKGIVFADHANDKAKLDSEVVRSSMTPGEESFAALVDQLIQEAHPVYYKAALVEVLAIYHNYCQQHEDVKCHDYVVLGDILAKAAYKLVELEGEDSSCQSHLEQLLMRSPETLQHYVTQVLKEQLPN
ncbi:phosphorylase kinase alphabeta [Catenovulum agarivorans DS-2]|uniref:Phosphorylase kinase alphabeta n=1 Tax=Catenovulum agarivorans DS-2 TaxID=1328313 RepID=W7QEU3_9ALTE|nr:glycoside hydrolase family 15 protein [Catenovulum agarivorans]EWH10441.1 phosphorylase kinase alphabeta [Catenovulum agarivorans DS-2]